MRRCARSRSAWRSWCARWSGWRAIDRRGRSRRQPRRAPHRRRSAPFSECRYWASLLIQAAVALDLVEDLAVLDLPGRGPLLQVLDAPADLLVELLVNLHVLLED